jgi:hypothetical protein
MRVRALVSTKVLALDRSPEMSLRTSRTVALGEIIKKGEFASKTQGFCAYFAGF